MILFMNVLFSVILLKTNLLTLLIKGILQFTPYKFTGTSVGNTTYNDTAKKCIRYTGRKLSHFEVEVL